MKALKPCKAGAMILPGSADIEFPPADGRSEAKPHAECRPVPTLWGQMCRLIRRTKP